MKKHLFWWQLGGFVFSSVGGVLLHYLYELTGGNTVAAIFSGVNESTWEHMKLLFFPSLTFAIIQSRYFKCGGGWWIKLWGMLLGLLLIPALFYTVNGAFGKTPDWFNISIFFVSAAAMYTAEYGLFKKEKCCGFVWIPIALLLALAAAFALFTFYPPALPLFMDPISGSYGI